MTKKNRTLGIYVDYLHSQHVRVMREALDGKPHRADRLGMAIQYFSSEEGSRLREKLFTSAEWSRILTRTGHLKCAIGHGYIVYPKHMATVQAHLRGEEVHSSVLFMAVGYFAEGAGRKVLARFRLFTKIQWRKLLTDTGRDPDRDPYLR